MNGHQQANRLKYSIILALGLSMAQIASAVGLGPIVGVNSHMGQPLSASIRVDNLSKEEAQSASVSLASADEYRSRGIQRLPIHDQLRFKLTPSGNGYRIQVSSSSGIREPFINFLLTINAGGQKITREYALFLNPDPAGGGAPASAEPTPVIAQTPAPKPQTAAVTTTTPTPAPSANNIALGSGSLIGQATPSSGIPPASSTQEGWGGNTGNGTRVALQNQAQPAVQAGGGRYTVKSGDTLYRIAQAATPRGGDINAMMVAIQRANPHAFGNSSMNSLKAGATLTIPGSTVAAAEAAPTPSAESAPRNTKRNRRQAPAPQTPPTTETPAAEEIAAATPPAEAPQIPPAAEGDEGAAPALTAEVAQETGSAPTDPMLAGHTPESEPTTPSGMYTSLTLDGLDNVGNATAAMLAQGENPSSDVSISTDLPQPDAPLEMPPSTDMTAQTAPVETTPPATERTPSEPPAVSSTPMSTPPTSTSSSSLELPFGLQLWHLLLAGGLLVTAILLTLLMKARRSRNRDDASWDEMSPAELDRMTSELEANPDLQRALAGGLHDLDDLSYESLSQAQEKTAQHTPAQLSEAQLERERLKARMAELDALQAQQEQEAAARDDFEQLQQKAAPTPSFDLHINSTESAPKANETVSNSLFDEWDFGEQESTVQTSAHETNVDDFFNVDEKLEDVIKPASAVERVSFSRSDLQSAPVSATVATAEADPEKIEAMEINLDLATSFIATGNASRARVWLEEVLLEGSASQKALAAQLLKKVDAQK